MANLEVLARIPVSALSLTRQEARALILELIDGGDPAFVRQLHSDLVDRMGVIAQTEADDAEYARRVGNGAA